MVKLAAPVLALCVLLGAPAQAQVLYKWIDADGKTQYSDRPPKNFTGQVTLIQPDEQPPPPAPARAPAAAPAASAPPSSRETPPEPPDRATQRRALRSELDKRLTLARAHLEAARKALDEVGGPEPDERQVVQQQQKAGQGGMHGLSVQRSNCRDSVDKDGKKIVICPAVMPNEMYFDRVAKLEEAVKRAEEELADAQEAWRRGVD